ncbi:adenylyl-sulfate kinase [Methylocucumis oryzae]|uniref:Adenylyl-sulfate kinase n=1 Tax=Methylocucumis oryzae TaxID=1632867 RepID=A0A0F3IFH8_9GAMM|nr:adenylyl-sulfate kinase [Methylocucumis oryzae]KJV05293.1 adenylylsulfate kinase [Methylocucumis oryzae]
MTKKSSNTVWHHATITRADREKLHGHKSVIVWFTGLSGSGKSTLAHAVEDYLHKQGISTFVLDGDNVRHGLCSDLSFSDSDRIENIRRIGELAKLIIEAGVITLTAFISPFKSDRNSARNLVPHGDFLEIYCQCPIETCEQRDVKGLYKKARAGEIPFFTGIDSPYEAPEQPELVVNTHEQSLDDSVQRVIELLVSRGVIQSPQEN